MTRIISRLALCFLMSFLAVGLVFAQTDLPVVETVSLDDLGVSEPGILPTNPFYFLKEWGRGVRSFFTFNRVAKAELELRITNEKAAELKKVQETRPDDTRGIDKALLNYQKSQERLKIKFEAIRETSQNPNMDSLLDKLTDRIVKHEKLFDEIAQKSEHDAARAIIQNIRARIGETVAAASKKDDSAKFVARLEKSLVESRGSELKHIRSLEILDRLEEKVSEDLKQSLEKLRQEFSERLREDIKRFVDKEGELKARQAIIKLPGDIARRSVLLEELREKAEGRVANTISKVTEALENSTRERSDIAEKAKEQIRHAEDRIRKLESETRETDNVSSKVSSILAEAKDHIQKAKSALEEEKYGEAFGQARSAEVLARNALRILEDRHPRVEDLQQELAVLEARILKFEELIKTLDLAPEVRDRVNFLLGGARESLGNAKISFEKGNLENTKGYMDAVKNILSSLSRIKEPREEETVLQPTLPIRIREAEPKVLCTQQYDPVCGVNGKTYSNVCFAKVVGVEVKHRGKCEIVEKEEPLITKPKTIELTEPILREVKLAPAPVLKREPQNVFVAITFQGKFDLEVVKIKKGDKVTWVNKGNRQVWPASNLHPTHTVYPDSGIRKCGTNDADRIFDACRALKNGESYSFIFEKVGRWKYHDHWSPVITGVVEVTE